MNTIEQETTTTETVEKESYDLNVNDLNMLKNIIDIASTRGAFRPNEMVIVGQTYNKLTAFLDQVAKQQELAKQQSSEAEKESN